MEKQSLFAIKQAAHFNKSVKGIGCLDLSINSAAEKVELEAILRHLSPSPDKKILDLGCGIGRTGLRLAGFVQEVVGLDISEESLLVAKRTAAKYGILNFKAECRDLVEVKDKYSNYFDGVIMVNLLHHLQAVDTLLAHVYQVLKPHGVVVIVETNPFNLLMIPYLILARSFCNHLNFEYVRSNLWHLKRIIQRNGFKVEEIERYGFLPTCLYSRSLLFKKFNEALNKIPVVNAFCAFHIIRCVSDGKTA